MYGKLMGKYYHDLVFLSRALTGHGMTIFGSFESETMSKGEISADMLCEERRLHKLAAETCDHGYRRGQCSACETTAALPPVVAGDALLSDPRWDVVAKCSVQLPELPLPDAATRDAIPDSLAELIRRRRVSETKATEPA